MKEKTINQLTVRSNKDDPFSSFQLYEHFLKTENNEDNAEKYLKKTREIANNKKIKIEEIEIKNFKKFEKFHTKLDKNLTVFIGKNGDGKSTVLEAISKNLSWLSANIRKEDTSGIKIKEQEVRNKVKTTPNAYLEPFTEISAKLSFGNGNYFNFSLVKSPDGMEQNKKSYLQEVKMAGRIIRTVNAKESISLPIYAYYSINRFSKVSTSTENDEINNRFDAYKRSFDTSLRFDAFTDWYITTSRRASSSPKEDIEQLKNQVEALESSVESGLTSLSKLLDEARKKLRHAQSNNNKSSNDSAEKIKIMNNAITSSISNILDIEVYFDSEKGEDTIRFITDDESLDIDQLSDGQRVFLCLIGDITRRLLTLNPDSKNPLQSSGIILIDEIELHLHPEWQQKILIKLQELFPEIQFIVTTHSPQVLSTIDKKHIRQFYFDDEKGTTTTQTPKFQTRGVISSDILDRIMGTKSTPEVPEALLVDKFKQDISENQIIEAKEKLKEITQHFGDNHPVTQDCQSQLEIYEFRKSIMEE